MNVSPVLLTVDGDTPHPHLCAGSEHPDGNLSPVGHQHLLDGLDGTPSHLCREGEVGGGECRLGWPPSQPDGSVGHVGDHLVMSVWPSLDASLFLTQLVPGLTSQPVTR